MKSKINHLMSSEQIKMDIFLIFISVVCGACNFYGFILFLNNEINWHEFLVIHFLLLVLMLAWYPFFQRKMKEVYRDYIFLVIFFMASGFMGALGYIIYCAVVFCMFKTSGHLEELYMELFPERDVSESTKIYENILTKRDRKAEDRDVVSFRDTLLFGSLSQKQNVIAAIVDDYNFIFAPVLLMATRDAIAAVRTSSATAVSRILDKYLQKQILMKRALEEDENNVELWAKYAEFLDEYAYCGLLDNSRHKEILTQALDANIMVYNYRPTQVEIIHKIVRVLVRIGDYKKAKDWIDVYYKTSSEPSAVIEDWNIETLYNLGEYDELRKQSAKRLAKIKTSPERSIPKEYLEALELWGNAKHV